jgi:predicted acetyltransferase
MEIKKLTPENFAEYIEICQTVFFDMERDFEIPKHDDKIRFGIFENGKLQSALQIIPYEMRMNGKNVKMGGIGAVVTRPESRGQGHMNALMKAAFGQMHENEQIFSFLYPFSFAYYRKFGYETCYARDKVKIPVSQLRGYKCETTVTPHEPGDPIQPYKKIYEEFTRERNLSIVRDTEAWKKILERDPYTNLEFTYLFRDTAGDAAAYILYEAELDDDDGNRLIIQECCWTNPQALRMVFSFLSKLGAEYEYVHWNAPSDINIHMLIPEGFDAEWSRESTGMNRIVNIPAALKTLRAPEKNGRVTIGVTDKFLTENTGVYTLEWESGILTAKKTKTATPDMETTAETLAQLVTGCITPDAATFKNDTVILNAHSAFNALFPMRHLYIMERY